MAEYRVRAGHSACIDLVLLPVNLQRQIAFEKIRPQLNPRDVTADGLPQLLAEMESTDFDTSMVLVASWEMTRLPAFVNLLRAIVDHGRLGVVVIDEAHAILQVVIACRSMHFPSS